MKIDKTRRGCAVLFPFWNHLSAAQQQKTLEALLLRSFAQTAQVDLYELVTEGDLWAIARGSINLVMRDSEGRECRLLRMKSGDVGYMLFAKDMLRYYVEATVEKGTLLCVLPEKLGKMLIMANELALESAISLARHMAEQILNLSGDVIFSCLCDRLTRALCEYSQEQKSREVVITHEQLANDLGTSREVISRLLREMSRDGSVTLTRGRVLLNRSYMFIDM